MQVVVVVACKAHRLLEQAALAVVETVQTMTRQQRQLR
jgi:hypothetical protein